MAWQDRLLPCTYTSPSGKEFNLQYEDVSRTLKKKTTTFEFVYSNDVYVQDNKVGAISYPLIAYFSGEDHDLDANEFFTALSEQGAGQLQHCAYGLLTVVATGNISQTDRLKTGANESVFDITFVQTITDLYPSSQSNSKSEADAASTAFDNAKAGEYSDAICLNSVTDEQSLISEHTNLLGSFKEGLNNLAEDQECVKKLLDDTFNSINNGIGTLIGDPLTLLFQTEQMIKSVTNSAALIEDKLTTYGRLLDDIISPDNTVSKTYNKEGANSVQTQDAFAATTVSAMVDSVVVADFDTREQALETATELQDYFYNYIDWKERNYASVGIEDTGASYDPLLHQVSLAVSGIIDLSFSLKRQRTIVLTVDIVVLDFAYQYFGSTDNETVEDVIVLNDLDNSDIWTIKAGTLMKYYVS